jgi:hypothetical protein
LDDVLIEFPDEFLEHKEVPVFHFSKQGGLKFQDIIDYLTKQRYPEKLNQKEKILFHKKMVPYSLVKGILFKMRTDDVAAQGK